MTDPSSSASRTVVRAACLNCRSAKRRCDGVQPVCGPCMTRGIGDGGCNFVSSKRGGPRYKGVRGSEAAKVKAEREKEREELRTAREGGKREGEPSQAPRTTSTSLSDSSSPDAFAVHGELRTPDAQTSHWVQQQHPYQAANSVSHAPQTVTQRSWQEHGAHADGAPAQGPSNTIEQGHQTSHVSLPHHMYPLDAVPSSTGVQSGPSSSAGPFTSALSQAQGLFPEQQMHYQLLAQQNEQMLLQQIAPLSPHNQQASVSPHHHVTSSPTALQRPSHHNAIASPYQHFTYPSSLEHSQHEARAQQLEPTKTAQASLDALLGIGFDDLASLASLEIPSAQSKQDSNGKVLAGGEDPDNANGIGSAQVFNDFFANLELLPQAGNIGACGDGLTDPLDVLMEWDGAELGTNVQDNEQGARMLLTDFYNLVYPSCPVLPSPGSLPSLAFYFSGKGPCGLFAALSAVVALHLTSDEALRTLKASQHPLQEYESCTRTAENGQSGSSPAARSAEDVAAYHAKTSEFILHQWEEKQRTCFMDLSASNPFDGLDEELINIEAGAAHILLCHYHYGSNKPLSHQRAYKHAVEAWNLMQRLDISSRTTWQHDGSERANPVRPFAADLKLEWAKRVYWASYASATVMSCTGGFAPFGHPLDGVMDLKLRPSLDHDVSAWSVMVRGAQQVSKCYRLLYELDYLRSRVAERETPMSPQEMQQVASERQVIFDAMLKLDAEISTYTRFDAGWRDVTQAALQETKRSPGVNQWPSAPAGGPAATAAGQSVPALASEVSQTDRELARSLKVAGRLMTSGAIILLHRAQAFSNARVFMAPQCGVPQATRASKSRRAEPLVHKDDGSKTAESGAPHGNSGRAASSRNGSTMTFQSTDSHLTTASTSSSNGSFANDQSFLSDRYAGGPFEPSHSLERCRFAASTMVSTLPRVLQDLGRVPKLPPYSACSYVLGAYAILMLTLLLQVRSDRAWQQQKEQMQHQHQLIEASDHGDASSTDSAVQARKMMLRGQLEVQRAPVRDMIAALSKFALVWPKAVEYAREVSTLLQANETIG